MNITRPLTDQTADATERYRRAEILLFHHRWTADRVAFELQLPASVVARIQDDETARDRVARMRLPIDARPPVGPYEILRGGA